MAAAPSSLFGFSTSFQRISTLLLWFLLLAQVNARNRKGEVHTLLRFKTIMEVDSPPLTQGHWSTWKKTDNDPCAWDGVICTSRLTVEQLELSNWNLERLPSLGVLSKLPDLRELDLSSNSFTDQNGNSISIPNDIGTLVGLTHLKLSDNTFSGQIPPSISACRNLRYLSLQGNALTGEIPNLSDLVNLQYLLLSGNQLSGPIPKWLGNLSSPLKIDLSNNMFNGTIPSLSNLTNLLELFLDNNTFTGFEGPIFPDAKSLEHLSVSGNELEGSIPPSITQLLNLKTLDMSHNNLSGPIPPGFSLNMSDAIWIELSFNRLTGNIPENLLQPTPFPLVNRPSMKLSHNRLTGPIPFDGTKQYNYHALDVSHNNLSGRIPSICSNGTSSFTSLCLQNNSLFGDIVDFLGQCYANIGDMKLANNSFTGDLSRMANVDPTLSSALGESILRQVMDLSNNNLQMSTTEANPDPLRAMLKTFVLNTSITEFRVQGNNFSGIALPTDFPSSANFLQVLDLSNNHLVGEISREAFNSTWLPALQSLYLSNNDATGPIPEALLMLPNLTVLDVTNNSLSGPLPDQLPNRLYNPSFFAGNDGLCGAPLRSCSQGRSMRWWVLLILVTGSISTVMGSIFVVTWRWKVYRNLHQQDADLIKMLVKRESTALMSLQDLRKATDNFAESTQIGAGGFGTVYTGKLNDGTLVAIKRSKFKGSESDKDQFLNEVRMLSQVNHRHLVKLLGCCMENQTALLVFEFVSNGTLEQHLQGNKGVVPLSWKQRLCIAIQTADALNYLHSAITLPIYHSNVKSANILLDDNLHAKVADFRLSKLAPLEATHVSTVAIQGTIGYIDPEYYTSYQLTDKSDVYSFGVVLLELISAKPAIDFQRGGEQTGLVSFAIPHIESGDLREMIDFTLMETYNNSAYGRDSILNVGRLATKCLHMPSKARPSMHEVWKELQNIWVEFQGTCKHVGSTSDVNNEDPEHDHIVLLPQSFSCNSSSSSPRNDDTFVQMSPLSRIRKLRSKSNQQRWQER